MHELKGQAAAEQELDEAAAWFRMNYGGDLHQCGQDLVHFEKTGERRTPPLSQTNAPPKSLTAKG